MTGTPSATTMALDLPLGLREESKGSSERADAVPDDASADASLSADEDATPSKSVSATSSSTQGRVSLPATPPTFVHSYEAGSGIGGFDLRASETGMPLAELLETYWDSRVDLLDRKWRDFSAEVKQAARARKDKLVRSVHDSVSVATGRVAPPLARAGRKARSRAQKAALATRVAEMRALHMNASRVRAKVRRRVDKLQGQWNDAKVVRIRDAISFVVGVENLVVTSLMFALRPQWLPAMYTMQCCFFLPLRFYTYSRQHWHYYLADFCYLSNALLLLFLWVLPDSPFLFAVCYCCAYGPLGMSIIAWKNSMVFHSAEKLTSLFIHIYPLLTVHAIRHAIPRQEALEMFPALAELPGPGESLPLGKSMLFSFIVYSVWQTLYWSFISRPKKAKIQSGERANSFITMVRGRGMLAPVLGQFRYDRAERWFMVTQFVYTMATALPAPMLYFRSKTAASAFVFFVQLMSVWNGATFYMEVWGRRFEKEMLALRAEIEAARQAESALDDVFDPELDSASGTDTDTHSETSERPRRTTSTSPTRATIVPAPMSPIQPAEVTTEKDKAPLTSTHARVEQDHETIIEAQAEVDAAEDLANDPKTN